MTIQEIINILQKIALTQPNVSSVGEGDIYDTLNAEASTRYAYFFITQNRHQQTEDTDRYSLNIFYIDRLTDDKSNKLQIQSIGKEVLGNVFNTFCEDFDIEVPTIEYQVFTERFSDYCAGVYATVAFEVMREGSCADYYDGKYEHLIPVKIINQTKQVKFTANGMYDVTYDRDYTGLENAEVEVDVDVTQYIEQGRQEGYNDGYAQGETEGYGQGYANGYSEGETKGYDNGYSNGYSEGETEGISQGIEQGISQGIEQGREQVRNEAEDLYLTENGVYEGENLYKRVEVAVDVEEQYNKGYQDGANAASADAVVLEITENGTVYTKFAELPEWTEPETGDDFYSYAEVESVSFNTGIIPDFNTKIEFWWKRGAKKATDRQIVGTTYLGISPSYTNQYQVSLNGQVTNFDITEGEWHHFQLSMTEGFWMDGVQIATYTGTSTNLGGSSTIVINDGYLYSYNSGCYGMVKINDTVIIPTDNGLKNLSNGELLTESTGVYSKIYNFHSIEKPAVLNNLIKQVNVNAIIDVAKEKLKFSYSTFEKTPDYLDFSGVVDMSYMFANNKVLKDLSNIKDWDTSKVTNMNYMFGGTYCPDFSAIKDWNMSNVTNTSYMFANNGYIKDFSFLGNWDTSKVTNMSNMLDVSGVTDLPTIDCSSVEYNKYPITLYSNNTKLVNVGGFLNMRSKWDDSYGLSKLAGLSYESYINIINGLYDFTANGETPNSNQGKLRLHSNAFNLLTTDDIARATAKGWTLS